MSEIQTKGARRKIYTNVTAQLIGGKGGGGGGTAGRRARGWTRLRDRKLPQTDA